MENNSSFYEKVKFLAAAKKVSVKQMERDIGIAENSAKKWKGDSMPNSATLQKIADYFSVSADYLLNREPDDETIRLAEELRKSPGMRMLFNSTKGFNEEEMVNIAKLIDSFRGKN